MRKVLRLSDLVPRTDRFKQKIKPKRHEIVWNILDDETVRTYKPLTNHALLIRVLDPIRGNSCWDKEIYTTDLYNKILNIRCDDIVEIKREGTVLFDKDDVHRLQKSLTDDVEEIVVHCGLGISRSAGLMLGLAKSMHWIDIGTYIENSDFYIPNTFITKTIVENWKN